MYCYQCEQTAGGAGCTRAGVCGKDAQTAALQDLLVFAAKGISQYAHRAAVLGRRDRQIDVFVAEALFATVTNVDFDPARLEETLHEAAAVRDRARTLYADACAAAGKSPDALEGPAAWQPAADLAGLTAQGDALSIAGRKVQFGEDVTGLQELITYGLKGAAAYMDHAHVLGKDDPAIYALFHEALDFLTRTNPTTDELVGWALKTGELNLKVMELLDAANTGAYGHPEPTEVRVTPVAGKAIVVSGHDLKDLEELLKQTEGRGVNVYTHGEMLPCHGYPGLKKYKHLVGNYGGAWQDQQKEFDVFPGAILMTTNCIQRPRETYHNRIFTTGLVAWPGVTHIGPDRDFTPVIEAALAAPGFEADAPKKTITVGFGHNAVLGVADKVIEAVKKGAIRRFFLIGGCDGAKSGRNYYTDLAQQVPDDCVILTLACGKYRFNKLDFGHVDGIPRLLDVGQCNDAYSAIRIAVALAEAFGCGVNDLPLSFILSWYEQKAVAILLTLLHLGVRNIRLGPTLPAFVTPAVLGVLVDQFAIAPITTPEADLRAALA
ncbi:MAG: hydroxylamine reductase [Pirellulales bacterium]|nr:hydroxylamine reductase [Pirellulales bacterium]